MNVIITKETTEPQGTQTASINQPSAQGEHESKEVHHILASIAEIQQPGVSLHGPTSLYTFPARSGSVGRTAAASFCSTARSSGSSGSSWSVALPRYPPPRSRAFMFQANVHQSPSDSHGVH
jgi:hypothetical protein